jgi:hypothetical protein
MKRRIKDHKKQIQKEKIKETKQKKINTQKI